MHPETAPPWLPRVPGSMEEFRPQNEADLPSTVLSYTLSLSYRSPALSQNGPSDQ